MPSRDAQRHARATIATITSLALLTGCAGGGAFSTQASRIGYDDGTDACRPQLVALDSTGNFFGEDIMKGAVAGALGGALIGGIAGGNLKSALIGAAAGGALGAAGGYYAALQQQQSDQAAINAQVYSDLSRENEQIDRTQVAFDQLMDCRFGQAAAIRADLASGRIDRPHALAAMALVKQRADSDLNYAQQLDQKIEGRAAQFEVAAEHVSPAAGSAIQRRQRNGARAVAARAAPLKLRPAPDAPEIASLSAREPVTVSGGRAGYALVETASGAQGYVPADDLRGAGGRRAITTSAPSASSGGSVVTLASSNAARRDSFAESVAVSQHAASSGGFELAG